MKGERDLRIALGNRAQLSCARGSEAELRKDLGYSRAVLGGSEAELRKDTGYRGKGERSRAALGCIRHQGTSC